MVDLKEALDRHELENLPFLKGAEFESIRGLLEGCPVKKLESGEVLISAGKHNETFYLLLSGQLRVHLKLSMDPIAILEPGEVVGEISVIDGQPTTAYVVADGDSRLLVMDENSLWSLVESSSRIARNLLYILAQRLRQGNALIATGRELQHKYEFYATTDAVTGLYNRRRLNTILARQMERSQIDRQALSVILIDIDSFKKYNDTYGHVAGDSVLYAVAGCIRKGMRPGEIIGRYREDEFMILLPDTDATTSEGLGERLCKAVSEAKMFTSDRDSLASVTISVGVAQMTAEDTPETFMAKADRA
ncbi:GGDEF domain-containing protein, partial [Acidobacteria bacterium AH-259-D05]|nr:GGDEF domain-containing protein [Acidobacteria bacterium AH-259-D05]